MLYEQSTCLLDLKNTHNAFWVKPPFVVRTMERQSPCGGNAL